MELAKKLIQARHMVGLSQEEVAAEMGWMRPNGRGDNSVVSAIENGSRKERAIELALHYIKQHGIKRSFFFLDELPDRVFQLKEKMDEVFDTLSKILDKLEEDT